MTAIVLRPYQQKGVEDIRAGFRRARRLLYVLPTGGGKTLMFAYIAAGVFRKGKRVHIHAHRHELLEQISDALRSFSVPHGVLEGGSSLSRLPVLVSSVQTYYKRIQHIPPPDLIIGDEFHHFLPDNISGKCVSHFPNAMVLGVTATPCRLDGRGLGESADEMILGPSITELIQQKYLVPPQIYGPKKGIDHQQFHHRAGEFISAELEARMNKRTITGDAITHYKRHAPGFPFVAFCVSIKHAEEVARQFTEAGYPTRSVDGTMNKEDRRAVIKAFRAGQLTGLTSCSLISEGFDVPGIFCAISLRPTDSESLWLQQVGRTLRPFPGKEFAVILDHAGNTHHHGMPDSERQWTLAGGLVRHKANPDEAAEPTRTCTNCFAIFDAALKICPRCGTAVEIKSRRPEIVEGDLELMTGDQQAEPATHNDGETLASYIAKTRTALEIHAKKHNYNPRWASYALAAKVKKFKEKLLAKRNMEYASKKLG